MAEWLLPAGRDLEPMPMPVFAAVTGSVPCERNVRDRHFAFYDWCACNDDISKLTSLHPRPPPQITHRNQQQTTPGKRIKIPSRLL